MEKSQNYEIYLKKIVNCKIFEKALQYFEQDIIDFQG